MTTRLDDWVKVSGQVMEHEMAYLQQMIGDLEFPVVVELGTCQGRSTCALALACEAVGGHVWTIDDFDPATGGGYVTPDLVEATGNIAALKLTNVTIIVADSTQAGLDWEGPPIDLWFHDAGHFKDEVERDIEAWWLHIRPGGYMTFHDYTGTTPDQIGVSQAANELLGKPARVTARLGIFQRAWGDE